MSQSEKLLSWQGIRLEHPADWELVYACGAGQPGRVRLADRRFERLDLRWTTLKTEPNLDAMLKKYHQKEKDSDVEAESLPPSMAPWKGVIRHAGDGGTIVHAGRFFAPDQTLVEAAIVWPDRRDRALEKAILDSIACHDPQAKCTLHQAMGVKLTLSSDYKLVRHASHAGRASWEFAAGANGPYLLMERLGMTRYWLKTSLKNWLLGQLGAGEKLRHEAAVTFNDHPCEQLISAKRCGTLASLRGRRRMKLDIAWLCENESRLYRLSYAEVTREQTITLPPELGIECCRYSPVRRAASTAAPSATKETMTGKDKSSGSRISAADILAARPQVNRAMTLTRQGDTAVAAIPVQKPKPLTGPLKWIMPYSSHRRIELDEAGLCVLEMCDADRTVEQLIEDFALEHRLSFREAQVPVSQFLQQMTQRGVVAIVGEEVGKSA